MLKYETPSWFYGDKRVDYGIREVSVCPRTPPKGMLRRPHHYDDSSMYAAVGDISYIAESVVPGKQSESRWRKRGPQDIRLDDCAILRRRHWLPNDVSACYKASPQFR